MSADIALQSYLDEARSWDADRLKQMKHSMRLAWKVAASGWLGMICLAIALMLLIPLERIEPFVIRVDSSTGLVDVVPRYTGQSEMDESITRYFLTHYVSVCERFNFATAESDYEECGAFHGALRNQQWSALWTRSNPGSPLNLYKSGDTVRSQVRSVSFFTRGNGLKDLAQVRYLKAERQGTAAENASYWIATVQYAYVSPSKDAKARSWNPLGFRIIDFKTEPEITARTEATTRPVTEGVVR